MQPPALYVSRDPHYDYVTAIEFGRVPEGQPPRCWRPLNRDFAFYHPPRARRPRGFHVKRFSEFDLDQTRVEGIWSGPRFAAPLLGLDQATAGEVILAARTYFGDEPSINRVYFAAGTHHEGEEALNLWRCCLESGDPMAHFALGYTLFELERHREAYRHLRRYAELAPHASWNWCWLGKAATAIGELTEARAAYERAIELAEEGGEETDAPELLAELGSSGGVESAR